MITVQTNGKDRDLLAQIEALKAEDARLKEAQTSGSSFKVSEKGLIGVIPQIQKFVQDNAGKLAEKQ
jgi:hypothetical protein